METAYPITTPAAPWSLAAGKVAEHLGTSTDSGLSEAEAARRLTAYGPNEVAAAPVTSLWRILLRQFRGLVVALLAAAAILSFVLGDFIEGCAVLVVLILNAAMGFGIEWRATRSMEALRRLGRTRVRSLRGGRTLVIDAGELVPGDVVVLSAGDLVPADLRLLESAQLESDESALTGESAPVAKSDAPVPPGTPLAERTAMLYRGARITRGTALGLVVATGSTTELGHISTLVAQAKRESTPLEQRLDQLGNRLVWLTLGVAVITGAIGIASGKDVYLMAETALALAVAAIPEGLPVVATIALARGLWRMAERNALINRLSAVETLGATGIICTDKTGTLTENRLRAVVAILPGSGEIDLEGRPDPMPERLRHLLRIAVLCNNADDGAGESEPGVGDPLESALVAAATRSGMSLGEERERFPRIREVPFEAETRLMTTIHQTEEPQRWLIALKGAPEAVLEACAFQGDDRLHWEGENERLASEGLRVLAFAGKTVDQPDGDSFQSLEFAGLCGLIDPPRKQVAESIRECQAAGIRVIMVTGDQPQTGAAIARQIGLLSGDTDFPPLRGADFPAPEDMSAEIRDRILRTVVFARVTPAQKLQLVHLHQRSGAIVAMTGDGVNDAPALKQADIGIAMGLRGTEVAREAAEMVLKDDSFPSIVVAIAQGRAIFANIRKFVVYLISCNLSEIFVVGCATAFASSLPLLPLQILFLNLVTDVFPALALGVGAAGSDLMLEAPRPTGEPIVRSRDWRAALASGALIALATLAAHALDVRWFLRSPTDAVTVSFLTLTVAQLFHVFNMAGKRSSWWGSEVMRNPAVWVALAICAALIALAIQVPAIAKVLALRPPSPGEWLLIVGLGLVTVVAEWGRRLLTYRR